MKEKSVMAWQTVLTLSYVSLLVIVYVFVGYTASHVTTPNDDVMMHMDENRVKWTGFYDKYVTTSPKCREPAFVLVLVHSAPTHVNLRNAIRQTWASDVTNVHERIKVVFVVGSSVGEHHELSSMLEQEADMHEDMLMLNVIDTYKNLTLKSVVAFDWLLQNCDVTYAMKTDDDVYLNLSRLAAYLHSDETVTKYASNASRFLIGRLIRDAKPQRRRIDRYYTPEVIYKASHYPPFLSGSAYIAPVRTLRHLIADVTNVTNFRKWFWLEDVFLTGIKAQELGISLIDCHKMIFLKSERKMWSLENNDPFFSLHRVTSKEMKRIHRNLRN